MRADDTYSQTYKAEFNVSVIEDPVNQYIREINQKRDDLIIREIRNMANGYIEDIILNKPLILDALTKAMKQRVIREGDGIPFIYKCPSCDEKLLPICNYCHSCGQKLQWRDEE